MGDYHHLRLTWARGLAALCLAGAVLVLAAAVPSHASAATCGGSGCNGQDPYQTGCASDQSVAGSTAITDSSGARVGTLTLYWSATCQSNWGSAAFDDGNPAWTPPVDIQVVGSPGSGQYNSGPVDFTYSGTGSPVWGNMVYSPGCAYANVTRGDARAQAVQSGCPTPQGQPTTNASCSGSGCQGQDPYQTGCADDQTVAGSAPITASSGTQVGTLTLYWSQACQSNWASASFNDGNPPSTPPVDIQVVGSPGSGQYNSGPVDFTYTGSGSPVWGNMVYSPGCAYGTVTRGDESGQAVQSGCPGPTQPVPSNGTCPDSPGAGTNVTRWGPVVACVLALLGQPTTPDYINDVFIIITSESSGNPNAINNWDINAQNGDPSRGLMQTILTTFEANRDPALPDNIYDPAANIYAGLHYGIHRYGSIPNIPGVYNVNHGGGYVGYEHDGAMVAPRGAHPCRTVDQGASKLIVVVRQTLCARGIKLARSLVKRTKTWHRLVRMRPDVLSRPFRLRGFSCRFKRFRASEVARLDLTRYWVGCFVGGHHVAWTSRPAGKGKNRARRIVKSRKQTR